jgi:hypothetical protein
MFNDKLLEYRENGDLERLSRQVALPFPISASLFDLQTISELCLKRQCHEIFDFRFSTWIHFPQAPDYTIRAVSNFFEDSRRYSQLKVHHWCR